MIGITTSGSDRTTKALHKMKRRQLIRDLNGYGEQGVAILSSATPMDSSLTAAGWKYRVIEERNGPRVEWYNSNPGSDGKTSVAILIQYGHATGTGGWVEGRDYINPAIQPMFDKLVNDMWKRVMMA